MMCIKKCQALEFIQTSIKPKQNQSELNGLSCYMSIISQFFKDIIVAWDIQKNSQVRLPLKLIRKWPQEKKIVVEWGNGKRREEVHPKRQLPGLRGWLGSMSWEVSSHNCPYGLGSQWYGAGLWILKIIFVQIYTQVFH